jgi:hypothetical protein
VIDGATSSRSDVGYFGLSQANPSSLYSYFACVLIVDGAGKYIFVALGTIKYLEQQIKRKGTRPNDTQ